MKIGILAGEIPPSHFIHQLVCNIAEREHTIFLYGSLKKKNFSYSNSSIILRVKPRNKVSIFFKTILLIIKLMYINGYSSLQLLSQIWINKQRIGIFIKRCCTVLPPFLDNLDIFHIQWAKTLVYYPEFIIKLRCPIILSLRGTHINVSPLADQKLALLYRRYFPKINGLHAVSKSIVKKATKYGVDADKITIINPAVDEKLLDSKPQRKSIENSDILKIISVGRCHWIKGYTFALDTMNILKKEGIQFHYTIIAGGRDHENIHFQIHDLGLKNYITFLNELPHYQVIEMLSECNLFILPSIEEGISNSVLEAMAVGVPVISTDCGGMVEVIKHGENGFIVPVRDPKSMADTIQKFQHLDETDKMIIINNAKETIISYHLIHDQVVRFKSFYSNIIKSYTFSG